MLCRMSFFNLSEKLSISVQHKSLRSVADEVAEQMGVAVLSSRQPPSTPYILILSMDGYSIEDLTQKAKTIISVDFVGGAMAHRRKFGGGKGQDIAKAVGLNKGVKPRVLDLTAGMGRDAFVLASLGCSVVMVERSPLVSLLLKDGLNRAKKHVEMTAGNDLLTEVLARIRLVVGESCDLGGKLNDIESDVVYLDPMFPDRAKSAKVKKDMAIFHELVGKDEDADRLLEVALSKALHRVVVKRPRIAPYLDARKPSYQVLGKSSRFDIYTIKAFS